jgi:S1-C subfamily serine protease
VSEAFLGAEFLPDTHPPQVAAVLPNSPAARASFKAKDVLIEFAGKPVPDFAVLRRLTFTLKPGQKVAAILLRKGKIFSVTVEMSAWD